MDNQGSISDASDKSIAREKKKMAGKKERVYHYVNLHKAEILILLMVFVLGGIFGFIYEEFFYRIDLGYFVKRGTTFGPWIPIYGFGAVLIILAINREKQHPVKVFLIAAGVSGVLEYFTGYFLLHFLGVRLWDYNTEIWNWMNVGGFICLRSVGFFGISAILLRYVIYPRCEEFIDHSKPKISKLVVAIPAALFVADILVSLMYHSIHR